jgi:hypothetical protein
MCSHRVQLCALMLPRPFSGFNEPFPSLRIHILPRTAVYLHLCSTPPAFLTRPQQPSAPLI